MSYPNRNIILSVLSGLMMLVCSCIPDPLDVEGLPVVKPQIVVSSQIVSDQSLVILLSKSFGALDASDDSDPEDLWEQIAVVGASVTLSGPNGTDTLAEITNGVYGGVLIPFQEGESYTLNVNSSSLGEVTATTTVRPFVPFDEIAASIFFNGFDDSLAQISYRINDPHGKNWYMINVQEVEQEDAIANLLNPRAFTKLMEDDAFDGSTYEETFRVVPRDYGVGDTIAVSLSNVSEEYYRFLKLRQDNRFNLTQFLSEPVNYPTNVQGGKGFFNLYIPDIRIFTLE
jgi:hypothetical protein